MMTTFTRSGVLTIACIFVLATSVKADWGWGNDGHGRNGSHNGDWNGCPPWWNSNDGCDNNDDNSSGSNGNSNGGSGVDPSQYGLTASQVGTSNKIITIHAVLASIVWVFLIPSGGILLRLGLRSPWVLRIHALLQVISYLIFIVAAGMGIWLVQQLSYGPYSLWDDPHTKLGVAILAIAFVQPFLGLVHHFIFKKRVSNLKQGTSDKQPGRTIPGYGHLWIGRTLIILGMINGGLGIKLASASPFASNQRSKGIAYGVCAAIMFLLYAIIVILFEIRKMRSDRELKLQEQNKGYPMVTTQRNANPLPSYDESQYSLHQEPKQTARYQ